MYSLGISASCAFMLTYYDYDLNDFWIFGYVRCSIDIPKNTGKKIGALTLLNSLHEYEPQHIYLFSAISYSMQFNNK